MQSVLSPISNSILSIESSDYLITKIENWIKKFKSKHNDREASKAILEILDKLILL